MSGVEFQDPEDVPVWHKPVHSCKIGSCCTITKKANCLPRQGSVTGSSEELFGELILTRHTFGQTYDIVGVL